MFHLYWSDRREMNGSRYEWLGSVSIRTEGRLRRGDSSSQMGGGVTGHPSICPPPPPALHPPASNRIPIDFTGSLSHLGVIVLGWAPLVNPEVVRLCVLWLCDSNLNKIFIFHFSDRPAVIYEKINYPRKVDVGGRWMNGGSGRDCLVLFNLRAAFGLSHPFRNLL